MRVIVIAIITLAAILQSTAQKSEIKNGVEYVTFTRDAFKTSVKLKAEQVKFNTPLNPLLFNFLNDTLILSFSREEKYHLGEIYDVRTGKLLVKCIPKGRGPGELLEVQEFRVSLDFGCFEVFDFNYNKFATFNIDSVLFLGLDYKPNLYEMPLYIGDVVSGLNKKLICKNSWNMFHDKFDNGVFAFCEYDKLKDINLKHTPPYGRPRRSSGEFLACPNGSYIYATRYYGEIQFWNKNFKKSKVLIGPNVNRPELYFNKKEGSVEIKDPKITYTSLCLSSNGFYVGYFDVSLRGYGDFMTKNRMEIFKIDWNGNFIKRFELDKCVQGLYVDSKGEYLYGTRNDMNSYPKLYRFKL